MGSQKISEDSLHTVISIISRIDERQKGFGEDIKSIKNVFEKHADEDSREFKAIRKEISGMNRYGTSIAIVAGGFGAIIASVINHFKS